MQGPVGAAGGNAGHTQAVGGSSVVGSWVAASTSASSTCDCVNPMAPRRSVLCKRAPCSLAPEKSAAGVGRGVSPFTSVKADLRFAPDRSAFREFMPTRLLCVADLPLRPRSASRCWGSGRVEAADASVVLALGRVKEDNRQSSSSSGLSGVLGAVRPTVAVAEGSAHSVALINLVIAAGIAGAVAPTRLL